MHTSHPSRRGPAGSRLGMAALVAAVLGLVSLASCAGHPAVVKRPADRMDGEILGLLTAIDEHELRLADAARAQSPSPRIQHYADAVHREHVRSLDATDRVAREAFVHPAAETDAIQALRWAGDDELAELDSLEGAEFDRAFVEATVRGHEEALDLIDGRLLPRAFDPAVRELLERTRGHIAAHLEQARQLQSTEVARS